MGAGDDAYIKLCVPHSEVSCLIGKGGTTVSELRRLCPGCKISISSLGTTPASAPPGQGGAPAATHPRTVTLSGPFEAVLVTLAAMLAVLERALLATMRSSLAKYATPASAPSHATGASLHGAADGTGMGHPPAELCVAGAPAANHAHAPAEEQSWGHSLHGAPAALGGGGASEGSVQLTLRALVGSALAGALIGKGGARIAATRQQSGVAPARARRPFSPPRRPRPTAADRRPDLPHAPAPAARCIQAP